jgi:hypothetical protein
LVVGFSTLTLRVKMRRIVLVYAVAWTLIGLASHAHADGYGYQDNAPDFSPSPPSYDAVPGYNPPPANYNNPLYGTDTFDN